jgi:hypothetical protein
MVAPLVVAAGVEAAGRIFISPGILPVQKRVEQHHAGKRNGESLGRFHFLLAQIGDALFGHLHALVEWGVRQAAPPAA